MISAATSDRCPYCGEPKDAHVFANPTTCVLASEVPDPPLPTKPDPRLVSRWLEW